MLSRLAFHVALAAILFAGGAVRTDIASAAGRPAAAYTYTLVTEPNQGLTPIYNIITAAKKTIDMTMYELTDTQAEQLLAQAAAAGVTVRVILDQNLEKSNNQAAYTYLSQNGVQVHWANPTYAATHQKTITADDATTAIMTLNLTSQYYSTSRDFAVIENDPNDISAIEQVFNADFQNQTVTPPDGDDLVWSPTNSQTALLNLINSAQHSLLIENEEMSDTNIVNALVSAASRGVLVQIAMTNDDNEYASEFKQLVAAGAEIATYAETASLYIHAKVILADYGSPDAQVFIGSENFSNASLTENRELGHDLYSRDWELELGLPWENRELWEKLSPFNRVTKIKTPTLIMGGEIDWNVPIINGEQMYQSLKRLGVPTLLVVYPGEYHEFSRPSFIEDRYHRYLDWYGHYVKGEGPAIPPAKAAD